jgi:hypothetical protein
MSEIYQLVKNKGYWQANGKYFDVKVMYLAGKDYCEIVLKTNDGYRKIKAFISDVSDDKANKTPCTPNNQPRTHSPKQTAAHTPTSPENKSGTPRATLSSRTSTMHLDPS